MKPRLARPIICVVTRARGARGTSERTVLLERLERAAAAGATMVQVRERQFGDRDLAEFVQDVIAVARPAGALVTVNDRTDVAQHAPRAVARAPDAVLDAVHAAAGDRLAHGAHHARTILGLDDREHRGERQVVGVVVGQAEDA